MTIGAAFEWSMFLLAGADVLLNLWIGRRDRRRLQALVRNKRNGSAKRTARMMIAEARWRIAMSFVLLIGAVRWLRIPDVNTFPSQQVKGAFFLLAALLLAKSLHNLWQSRGINDDYDREHARNLRKAAR